MLGSNSISATYRLQFNKDFTFQYATNLLDYLSELGITHVYASPILRSRGGSTHGYDVIDPTRLNPELGTEADFSAFQRALAKRGMGLIMDIVPNHMSASSENAWWMDVLENGPESAYAAYFDIDWHPPSRSLERKILLPVLGSPFGETLERQEFRLVFLEGRFFVKYFDSLFPLAPQTYSYILEPRVDRLKKTLGEESPAYQEYSGVLAGLAALSTQDLTKAGVRGERRIQFEAIRERLRQLASANPDVQTFLDRNIKKLEGNPGDPASFSQLERLLSEQFYVLSYWQNVNEEINYRRFFTISDLVGLRVEDPLVFDATHSLVKRFVEQGIAGGLRIDHIDGLRDPMAYLTRLREQIAPPVAGNTANPLPVFVEKILASTENLRSEWPVDGTTGYDFLNALNRFFVDRSGTKSLEEIYFRFIGNDLVYNDILYQKKKLVMATLLGVEMRSLGHQLGMLADGDRYARDLSRNELTHTLIETTAYLSRYRTYIRNLEVPPEDQRVIELALREAQARKFYLKPANFAFLREILLLRSRPHLLPEQREARLAFVMRWQQFTGPIMAKAFEDTFLYVFNPLISLNEVGGDPRPSTADSWAFTDFVKERSRRWPDSTNALTTHDTKRSEDVRARINVLSEIPAEWEKHLQRWSQWNAACRKSVNGKAVPDRNEEIFLYQTLLGAWPLEPTELSEFGERLQAYAIKATREAMVHTRWTLPNLSHENALKRFVAGILRPGKNNAFLADFAEFQERISYFGMINSLSQTLLKIISPGVPDFYQGSELWDLHLVDPDNRRPVDFAKRMAMLADIVGAGKRDARVFAQELQDHWRDARIKLYIIWKALNLRTRHPDLFAKGSFVPLTATGTRKENVAAFLRQYKTCSILALVPRWLANATGFKACGVDKHIWQDTQVVLERKAPESWNDVFTGEKAIAIGRSRHTLDVAKAFANFPIALLTAEK
jgi:(1->4)-alpha-D-glucan 1-alpha-D-glucosylmutase